MEGPQDGVTWRVRIHGWDPSAPIGSNAATDWVSESAKGNKCMDSDGKLHPPGVTIRRVPPLARRPSTTPISLTPVRGHDGR